MGGVMLSVCVVETVSFLSIKALPSACCLYHVECQRVIQMLMCLRCLARIILGMLYSRCTHQALLHYIIILQERTIGMAGDFGLGLCLHPPAGCSCGCSMTWS